MKPVKRILLIYGTRPEAIKMAPLFKELQKHKGRFETKICVTAQHRQMLDQVLVFFKIKPDYDLNVMSQDQTLFDITGKILLGLNNVLENFMPDLIFVQGDTTTAFVAALAGFYKKIKVAHLEAGLRSGLIYSPFPEEANRTLIGHLANYHFAPTQRARANLLREGISKNIYVVGNTVIDALFLSLDIIKRDGEDKYRQFFSSIDFSKKVILVTAHRRENFGKGFQDICYALKEIADSQDDVEIVYPVHLNPNVQIPVKSILCKQINVHLIEPLEYPYLVWLMNKCYLILTDSGGIQEEAPSLGKPVLIMRGVTERTEGLDAGAAMIVGTNRAVIVKETCSLLRDAKEYDKMSTVVNPYGDGSSSSKIVEILKERL
jgi:UDP-N-acetylglucosamine 2-epimerase (non-hydrolysing)